MPDWFENPAVRRCFGMAGLDWKAICSEQGDDTEDDTDSPPEDTETATDNSADQ
jgi:hypothetical protein